MAALLIALAIMAILLSVAMPVWRHEAQREKEAELVFRGEQYARAIALYRFKNANVPNAFPASIDMLVDGRYLRKKYKDPMSPDGEFQIMPVGSQQPGIQNPPGPGRGGSPQQSSGPGRGVTGGPSGSSQQSSGPVVGGIMGVRSKSQDTSIRSYRGQTRYDQWAFTFNLAPRPGGAMPMANTADGRSNEGRGGPGVTPPGGGGGRRGGGSGQPGGRGTGAGPGGFPPPPPPPPAPGTGGRRGIGPGGRGGGL